MANICKTKGHTVSMLSMFLITALLLNGGLLVSVNFGSFFAKITHELNASDVYYLIPTSLYSTEIDQYLTNNSQVLTTQKEDSLWNTASVPYNGGTRECTFLLNDAGKERTLSQWKFVGDHLPLDGMSVYLPAVMKIDGGYQLNDKITMTFKDIVMTFTVKGFTEDVFFSSLDTGILSVYLPHQIYEQVAEQMDSKHRVKLIYANLTANDNKVEAGIRDLQQLNGQSNVSDSIVSLGMPIIKGSRTMMATIISVMMVAFSAIIAAVCLIVVRYRIGNSIEEDMVKIGSLKAMGYTTRQIILSMVIQFSLIALSGSVLGIALSYLAVPLFSEVFAHQSGLVWTQGFDGLISAIALSSILLVVVAVSFFSSTRIRRLNPIVALRGGIITHSFRKNFIPLDRAKGVLPIVLALKSMLQNRKQSIMMGIIFMAVSFAGTFAVIMFYNTTVDTKAFAETPGKELSNAIAMLKPGDSHDSLVTNIRQMDGVRKVQFIDEVAVRIENNDVLAYVMEDYSQKETNMIYEGRYPLHSNEVVLAGSLAEMLGKKIGDSVTLQVGARQSQYIISGLSQGASRGGLNLSLTDEGLETINPDFQQQRLQIYLQKGVSADTFVKKLKDLYNDHLVTAIDMDKDLAQGMGTYIEIVSKVGKSMLAVTALVVALVLYFVINSSVIRRKRELGIQKALGFTTFQLMNQLSLGLLPPLMLGIAAGAVLGMTQTNPILTMAQRAMGVMKAQYIIMPSWILVFGISLVFLSYAISMLITFRIRKISAYGLVSE